MAWATPITHAVGDILTASDWNISSNDLTFLAAVTGATVATNQTTASTTYTDLSTVGPAVTVTTGANAVVTLTCSGSNISTGDGAWMSFAISGATTLAAADTNGLESGVFTANNGVQGSVVLFIPSLTAGSNTFTAKYRASGGGTAAFVNRTIIVEPLP